MASGWSAPISAIQFATVQVTPITGFISSAGVVADTDTVVEAISKLDGNVAAIGAVTAAVNSLNGFCRAGPDNDVAVLMTLTANILELAPVGATFTVFVSGSEYARSGGLTDSFDLSTLSEGPWAAYYGPEYAAISPWGIVDPTVRLRVVQGTRILNPKIITEYAIVSTGYWDATNTKTLWAEERHGRDMSGATHYNLHWTQGTRLKNAGGALIGFNIWSSGAASDANMQFGWGNTELFDEDIIIYTPASDLSLSTAPMLYLSGTDLRWQDINAAAWCSVGARPSYNNAGAQAQVSNGYYSYTLVGYSSLQTGHVFLVQGRSQSATLIGIAEDIQSDVRDIRSALVHRLYEFIIVGAVIFHADSSYANSYKAVIVRPDGANDYEDLRYININRTELRINPVSTIAGAYMKWDLANGTWISSSASVPSEADSRIATARGAANGIAPLDASSLLPTANLPSHASTHLPGGADALTTGAASALTPDLTSAAGTAAAFARQDHIHNVPTDTSTAIGNANAQGTGTKFSRNDHVHSMCSSAALTSQVPQWSGSVWTATNPEILWTPREACVLVDEFVSPTALGCSLGWAATTSGTNSTVSNVASTVGHIGQIAVTSGNGNNRYANWRLGTVPVIVGGGAITMEILAFIENLSVVGQLYTMRFGIGDVIGDNPNNGIYFEYDSTESANWRLRTANGNLNRTTTTSAIPVASGAFIRLTVIINAAGTSVQFLVNGAAAGTITTNIPTTGSAPFVHMRSGATNAARTVRLDYFSYIQRFTTIR
jgi:hypothetical protein